MREVTGLAPPEQSGFEFLTRRERDLLKGITEGLSNTKIGDRLHISEKTVRNQVSGLFRKLGVRSRAEAMVLARERRFLD